MLTYLPITMFKSLLPIIFTLLSWFPCLTLTCSPINWVHFSMERILSEADIIVYGKETERYLVDPNDANGDKNAKFLVYCVLKNDDTSSPIAQNIIIDRVDPVDSCSGTQIPPNKDILLALKRTSNGNFMWHEVNVTPDGAAFPVSPDLSELTAALKVCNLRSPVLPSGRNPNTQPTCPRVDAIDGGCNNSGDHLKLSLGLIITGVMVSIC